MKILIIGALGDIGSEITRQALASDHTIIALDIIPVEEVKSIEIGKSNLTYVQGNAMEFDSLLAIMKEHAPDGVITLAAVRTPEDYLVKAHNINVVITWNVLRAAAEVRL
jgi:nucleoside-diphosphate-sugar epimerase